jgi:uncharacterized protein (DUF1501 family)
VVALASTVPVFVARTARATSPGADRRILVVVQMDGGNDALNTIVPYTDPDYHKLRPRLRLPSRSLIRLNDTLALHPALRPLDPLLQAGQLATVVGVGYPNPQRSHFESMAIWHTARFDPEDRKGYGWLGRALDPSAATAYMVGGAVEPALRGRRSTAVSLSRVEEVLFTDPTAAKLSVGPARADDLLAFIRRQAVDAHATAEKLSSLASERESAGYPATGLGGRLKLVARLLKSNLEARVFYVVQGGYDTHASQASRHGDLLSEFSGAVAAFFADLKTARLADRVALLAFSEFGRTIQENASGGTDHGTTGAVLVAGPGVRGGVAGVMPSLTDLEGSEPKMTTDFRAIYAAVLDDWLGLPSRQVLGAEFRQPTLFRTV